MTDGHMIDDARSGPGEGLGGAAYGALAALIVRSATDFAIVTSDLDGVITSWSPGAVKTMGWTAAEALGRRIDMFFTPEDVADGRPVTEMACAQADGCASDDRWHMKRDGTRFWASGELQPLYEADALVGFVKILRDRTETHKLQQSLIAAEAEANRARERVVAEQVRLREMFQAAPGFIAVFRGRDLIYDFVNASYQRLVDGRARIGITLLDAVPEVAGQGYVEKLQAAFDSGVALTEYAQPVMLQPEGGGPAALHHVDYVFQPMLDVDGTVMGLFVEGFDVTDAVAARAAADKIAAQQAAILGQLGEGVIATDADGRIAFVNAAAERLHGVARLDVAPDDYSDTYQLLTEDGAPYPSDRLPLSRAVLRGETVRDARWRIRRPDGSEVLAIGNAQPVVADGFQVGAVLTVRDDTARTEAEAALRTSESRLQAITDSIDQMIWSTQPDGFHDYYNARWYDYTGTPLGSTDGEGWADMFHPDDHARTWAVWNRSLSTGEPYHIEYRLRHRSGKYRWVIGRALPVRDAAGAIVRWYGTCTDIHELKQAEERLRDSEARAQGVLQGMREGFLTMDRDFVVQSINDEGVRIDGRARADIVGRPILELWPETENLPNWPMFVEAMRSRVAGSVEYRHLSDAHDVWLEARAYPIEDGLAVFYRDVTARRQAEERLRETEERYRFALRATTDAVWDWDLVEDRILWNEALQTAFGHAPDGGETTGKWWIEHVHPDDRARIDAGIHAVIDGSGSNWSDEYRFRRADGGYATIFDRGAVIRDEQGRAVRMIGAMLDLTEREAAEAALRVSQTRYQSLFESIDAGFCVLEIKFQGDRATDYKFIEVNPAFERQTGLAGVEGRYIKEIAPGIEQSWIDLYGEVVRTGEPVRREDESKELGRWFEVAALRQGERHENRVAVLFSDITERKRAEEELREQTRTLETINRTGAALAGDLDLERLVQRVTDAGVELTGAAMGAFFYNVPSDDGQSMMLYTLSGISRDAFEVFGMPRATAIFQPTFGGEGLIRSDDIATDTRYGLSAPHHGTPHGHPPVRSYLAVSVTNRSGEVIGGLFFGHPEPGRFTERHEQLVVGIAAQAAIAIDNARLFDDAQRELGERRRAEEALTELNTTLESRVAETVAERDMIWQTSQDLFVVTGLDGVYRSVNPAWTPVLGWEPAELIGSPAGRFIHPDDLAHARVELARLAAGHVVKGMDVRMMHRDGSVRWMSWMCVPAGDIFYASGRDITARIELEEQLRQSQKMEAVGQLTGGIAHDFNNLLTIVSGNIDMARRSLGADGDARALRSLGNAAKGADRAAALTQRLLAFSRRQPLQPRATDVNKLIGGMTELLDRALGETVDLQVVAGAGLWRVEVDPNQLENAILNLAVNARDAMPAGGKLTVETNNAHIDEAYAAAQREVAPGQYVLISVTDTGEGMPPDIVAKAFDPFFSTKEVGKGTGLGLSQVYGYVKQSGGHVKIYSEAGEGTTIKMYLPRLMADVGPDEEEAEAEAPTHGKESILVVEDDDDVRIYTVDSLRELGYRVLEAHDGASALRLLERQEEAPRLLLTDVVMPGMSGRELADHAREAFPDLQVLYTTGYARNAIVHGGRLDPGVELLPKPFTYEALAAKVREVLEKAAVERALVIDADDTGRADMSAMLGALGFAAEPAASVREALGKLRASSGRYDVVMLSDTLPVGNFDAVMAELRAVRDELPILIVSANAEILLETYGDARCVRVIGAPATTAAMREALQTLRVRCNG